MAFKALGERLHLGSGRRGDGIELASFAEPLLIDETRRGLMTLGSLFVCLLLGSIAFPGPHPLAASQLSTTLLLAALSLHVAISARGLAEIRALHLLGATLLVITATAFVLAAHRASRIDVTLFTRVALLFMAVPLVPWGLCDAARVTLLIYAVFTLSTWSAASRFDPTTLFALQSLMLGAGAVSLIAVARGASVRSRELETRFELERARRDLLRMSREDALTRTWNRRFLEEEFPAFVEGARKQGRTCHFVLLDVNEFKQLNDRHGHAFGDRVLQWIGRAFRTHLRDDGHLVRLGGDEFAVLLCGEDPDALLADAIASLRALVVAEAPRDAAVIGISAGIVELPARGEVRLDDAYLAADGALYRAKRSDTNAESLRIARAELRGRGSAGA
jgi:diguanylate cyclase (GGDEF)-like protein